MLLMMAISFFTTRITLKALGVEDLGIYNIVGGVIILFDFISSGLTNATQRYLNIAIGKNDDLLIRKYFSQSLLIHILFSIVIIFLGETIGLWFLKTQLTIPENRMDIALWVYQFSILSVVVSLMRIPYNSAIIAYEKMTLFAYLGVFESIARLIIAYLVLNSKVDHLFLYSILMLLLPLLLYISYYQYCTLKIPQCKYKFVWDKQLVKEMILFIGYNAFGCISWAIGIKGIDFILNIFFNPMVNGARALAMTLSAAIQRFNDSIYIAAKPQIIKSYAVGDLKNVTILSNNVTKYSFYLLLLMGFPILSNTEYILSLWLEEIPTYTIQFTQLAIIESWVSVLPNTAITIVNASGKIKGIQVYARIITLLSIPVSLFLLKYYNTNVFIPIYVSILFKIFYWIYCAYIANKTLSLKMKDYAKNIILPITLVIMLFCCITYIINLYDYPRSSLRLIVSSLLILILGGCSIIGIGLSTAERTKIFKNINKFCK